MLKIELPIDEIAIQYKTGIKVELIASFYSVSKETIYKRLKENNTIRRNNSFKLVSKEQLKELYITKGYSISNISKKYRVSNHTVRKAIEKYQLKKVSRAKEKNYDTSNN